MAATRIVSGKLREVWREAAPQIGGAPQVVTTGIRISQGQLSRVKALLTIDAITGAPAVGATASVSAGGYLVVTVANPTLFSSILWTLDVELTHSQQQASDPNAAVILIANGTLIGGLLATETLSQAYNVGLAAADQTLTIDNVAHGGGIVVDAHTSVTAPLLSLVVQQHDTLSTNFGIYRRGDNANGPVLEFNKARGAYGAVTDVHANDLLGVIDFVSHVNGVSNPYTFINAICLAIEAGPSIDTGLDFYASFFSAPSHAWRMDAPFTSGRLIGYGATTSIEPNGDHEGYIGQTNHIWSESHIVTSFVYLREVIDSTNAGGALYSLEIRQSTGFATPTQLNRAGNDTVSPSLQFYKTRGTFSAQANIQIGDELGTIDFYGRLSGVPVLGSRIVSVQTDVGPNATALDFYITPDIVGTATRIFRMASANPNSNTVLWCYNDTEIIPDVDHHGFLGRPSLRWLGINVDSALVYANVRLGGGSVGGGANQTVMLPNTATLPAPQANQVYVGALDWTGTGGGGLAALAISSEELVVSTGGVPNTLIPITFNGVPYYLLGINRAPT
jgi:hypothetical protein